LQRFLGLSEQARAHLTHAASQPSSTAIDRHRETQSTLEHAVGLGLRTGFGDDWLRIGSVKVFMDGALGPRTAAMFQPYLGEPENRGILNLDAEELFDHARRAADAGLGMTVHAIGDRANHEVLDAYERLRAYEREKGLPHLRHRIEHVQVIHPADLPRLAALDGLQRSFYISGFSKILAPNWRVGYLAAPAGWVERLVDTKLLTTLTTPALTEQALAHCLEQGLLRRHVERVVQRLDAARARTVHAAESRGFRFAAPPRGLFGWVDAGCDTERLAQAMLDQGWLIAPGALFHAAPRPTTLMRVNFATAQDAAFWRELRHTCAHISRHLGPGAAA
jgi:hypothetical protein